MQTTSDVLTVKTTKEAPGFTAGTEIVTQSGLVRVEDLMPGHRVLTRDNGFQPLKWTGMVHRMARGADVPVSIAANTFGTHGTVEVSRNQRVLIKSSQAATLFGESEVLVAAYDVVNGTTVTERVDRVAVTYVYLLFDRHEIVRANGLDCESYHPSKVTLEAFDADTRAEILGLMPNTDDRMGYGYGPSARVSLRKTEAEALLTAA